MRQDRNTTWCIALVCWAAALAWAGCGGEDVAGSAGSAGSTGGAGTGGVAGQGGGASSSGGGGAGAAGTGGNGGAGGNGGTGGTPDGMACLPGGQLDTADGPMIIEGFCIDLTEATIGAFADCVADGACPAPADPPPSPDCIPLDGPDPTMPRNCVALADAESFCAWRGGLRLPTTWEWTWAARGREEARTHPWGEETPTCERVVMWDYDVGGPGCGTMGPLPVGSKPLGASRDGMLDMLGNVWEWTSTPPDNQPVHRYLRGGAWGAVPQGLTVEEAVLDSNSAYNAPEFGIRCAVSAP